MELGGSFRAAVTTCTGDPLPFRVPGGSRTHRAVFHSLHQVLGLGWHVPGQEERRDHQSWLRSKS